MLIPFAVFLLAALLPLDDLRAQGVSDPSAAVFDDEALPIISITIDPAFLDILYAPGNELDDIEYPARFSFESPLLTATVDSVGFRLRGNTSRFSAKKSFKVSFNTFRAGGKFLGLEKLNLNGEHNDPSIIRSKLGWDLFRETGVPASRANHVKVYINGDYYGLYVNVEHVDEQFLQRHFGSDSGNLYKCLWPANLYWPNATGPTGADLRPVGDNRGPYDLKLKDDDSQGYDDLARLISVVNYSSDAAFPKAIESIFDVNGFLRALAVTVLTGSWDTYWFLMNNYYLYNDPVSGRFVYVPFDFDNTFGIWWDGIWPDLDWGSRDIYEWGHPDPGQFRPLARRILAVPEYRERYTLYVKRLLQGGFQPLPLQSRVADLREYTDPAAEDDPYRPLDWGFTVEDYYDSFTVALGDRNPGQAHVTYGLFLYISQRYYTALGQRDPGDIAPVISDITYSRTALRPTDPLTVTARVEDEGVPTVELEYWPNGPTRHVLEMEMLADGRPDTYTATIPPLGLSGFLDLRVTATDDGNNERQSALKTLSVGDAVPPIYINELLALNQTTVRDEAGQFDDWLELYNAGSEEAQLAGMYLTDDLNVPDQWALPDTTIAPGGFLVVWTDSDPDQGPMHATFRLSSAGEMVALFDADLSVVDQVTFGPQTTDVSYGRLPDGSATLRSMVAPSPGSPNVGGNVAVEESTTAAEGSLAVYPNPFHSSVRMVTGRASPGSVRIDVFDALGRHVASPSVGTEGGVEAMWDGRDSNGGALSSGLYLIRVTWSDAHGAVQHAKSFPVVRIR